MKMSARVCGAAFAAAVMLLSTNAFADPTYTLKLAHAVPVENPYHYGAMRFKELVEAETKGDMVIQVFPNNELSTGERDILEGLQLGTIDMYVGSTGPMGGFEKSFLLFDFPFLFKDLKDAFEVLDGPIGDHVFKKLDSQGIHGLAWMVNGFRNLTNSKRPVVKISDVAGLKVRTMENKLHMAMWRELGADPTPMAWSEVFTALQQGTIDGQENPLTVIYTSKLNEVQKYLALTRHVFSPAFIAIASSKLEDLPEKYQAVIVKAAKAAALHEREVYEKMDAEFLEKLRAAGMEVSTPDLDEYRKAVQPVYEKYRSELGDDAGLLDQILSR